MENNVLLETIVSYNNLKYDTLLEITENELLFSKKKGLFKKKYKIIDKLLIADIKVVNDVVRIKQRNKKVIIYTRNDTLVFKCKNFLKATEVIEKIKIQRVGENFIERTSNKGTKIINRTKNTLVSLGTLGLSGVTLYALAKGGIKGSKEFLKNGVKTISKSPKAAKEAVSMIKSIIK